MHLTWLRREKRDIHFRSSDETDLKEKIDLMARNKTKLTEMGQNAFQKIQNWSFEHLVTSIENLVINKC